MSLCDLRNAGLGALLAAASPVQAQHKLFFSDVLDRGQTEVELSLSAQRTRASFEHDAPASDQAATEGRATYAIGWAAIGLADGLELGLAVPYYLKNETVVAVEGGPSTVSDNPGLGDIAARLKYRLYGSRETFGTLAVRASVLLDTAEEGAGSGTDAFVLGFYGTLRMGDAWRPYTTISLTARGNDRSEVLSVLAGIYYYARGDAWFIDAGGTWSRQGAESTQGPVTAYSLQLSGAWRLSRSWYARPSVSAIRTRDFTLTNPAGRHHGANASVFSIGVYRLF